ncbi:heavy metal translocating P-type ATPase [Arenimonas composti]|uniref:HMA domain-containing protein n=1 Tax=Arenimonas composti TR7-09 = DSM 18010 TaxID=1121013 RepID=A0A091C317_9GAMM|nr:heavy metal translocating P-type ATPase [Arenimonas composti]KFN51020.1 hypothetical protein P873_04550 [Arenimonas composti TR7-09 = DSM 18010]
MTPRGAGAAVGAAVASPSPAAGHVRDACHHCGEALPADPPRARIDGVDAAFCCPGCAAAARWIAEAGLADYYRLRSADGARVDPDPEDFAAWDRDDVLAGHAVAIAGGREITVVVDGMRCAACAWLIDRALAGEEGVLAAGANAVTGRVRIAWDPARARLSALLARLGALGYRAHLAGGAAAERERRRERNTLIARLGVATLGALQAMMYADALYYDATMSVPMRDLFRWTALLVSTPVVFFSGWPFLAGMARELRARAPAMDTLIAGSVLLAYLASAVQTLRGGAVVWFDAAVMFVWFLLIARFLGAMARQRAGAVLDVLARARPALVTREVDGRRERVPAAALQVGDVLRVAPGEALAADGELLAPAAFDESLLTGESVPVAKSAGDTAWAGSLCREASARLRVTRIAADTRLSQLVRLVEDAQAHRPRLARVADRVAGQVVTALLVVAAAVFALWSWQVSPERGFEIALAVLIVTCPCALSLAVPTALASAHAALARRGVLVLADDALDALAEVDTVVFDKTGTLSRGQPRLLATRVLADVDAAAARALAARLERGSAHPLAYAFAAFDPGDRDGLVVTTIPGHGLEADIDGARWRLGRASFATGTAGDDDAGTLVLARDEVAVAEFTVADPLRDDAADAVAALRTAGLDVRILSGDGAAAVAAVAAEVGIERFAARQLPQDKLAAVRALQAQGRRVLMVGDGLNDAPVLAAADVSIALAGGADLAHRAAGIVVLADRLGRIPETIALARRTRAVVRQNFGWAIAYNLVALPFAAIGVVGPGLAALGMAASSLLVTGNALRLGRGAKIAA